MKNANDLLSEALTLINENQYRTLQEMTDVASFSWATFYNHGLNKCPKILKALKQNKTARKSKYNAEKNSKYQAFESFFIGDYKRPKWIVK